MKREEKEALIETFKVEAAEILSELEHSLLELEKAPANREIVSSILRALHTIKGSGAMVGFDAVADFAHQIETVFDSVRRGQHIADKSLVDLTLASCDLMHEMIESPPTAGKGFSNRIKEILLSLGKMVPDIEGAGESSERSRGSGKGASHTPVPQKQVTYRIRFRPAPDIFSKGTDPLLLFKELRGMGECLVIAHNDEIPDLYRINPEACYTSWDIILTTGKGLNAIKDVFIFIEDECDLTIDIIDDGEISLDDRDYKRLGEILLEKGDIRAEDLDKMLKERRLFGEHLVKEGLVHQTSIQAALTEQEHVRHIRESRLKAEVISNLRVSSEKLDKLVNLVGELVTVQARLSQVSASRNDPEMISIAEEIERLTGELRDSTMNIRMLPIGTTFSKFKRLVRDLSKELGKEVELTTYGAETELDKTVIEKLNDPLVHLIRNCIDHGIESPEARESAGKPRKGLVHLSAEHSGDKVLIEIQDNGAGMDRETIRLKAVEKGLIAPDAELPDQDLFSLILLPGFSTTGNVTNVSGRGVGLDVVKKAVDSLRGSIEIASVKGEGTTITLSLPLTLAIIEGLLVKISEEHFILPLSVVEECVELVRKDKTGGRRRDIANVRGEVVPYIRLREQLMIWGEAPDIEQIVIIKTDGQRIGLVVDMVVGGLQTVIKGLGRVFKDIEGISGATILGDGTVALIMDIAKLVKIAVAEEVEI